MFDAMADLLDQYPFDLRLGSVHWIEAWLFDDYTNEAAAREWDHRGAESAWNSYEASLNELVQSELCQVVAHCDLTKVAGRYPDPTYRRDFKDRLVETLANSGLVVEVSSAGWGKSAGEMYPSPRILAALAARKVPITLGSDAHRLDQIGWEYARLVSEIRQAGFTHVMSFPGGQPEMVAISDRDGGPA